MHSNATYRGRANILKRPNRLNVRSGSVAGPPPYHAVLVAPAGMMVSWGMALPQVGMPAEAWWMDWEAA